MSDRIQFNPRLFSGVLGAMGGLAAEVRKSGLEPELIMLVKVRVSQINGCGFCVDMHTKDARAAGETEQRLYLLSAWHDANVYSERERAALAWCDAVTRLENQEVPDAAYRAAAEAFSEKELVALTLGVVEINGWNRFSIGFRYPAGDYVPGSLAALHAEAG